MRKRWKKILHLLKKRKSGWRTEERSEQVPEEEKSDGQYLCCVMSWEICEFARRKHGIARKNHRIIIVDDGSESAMLVLRKAGHDINHLTLATDREEHFERILGEIYEEDGLVVEVTDRNLTERGMTLSFNGKFCIRMEDKTVYQTVFFHYEGKEWEAGELQTLLFGESSEELFLFGNGELPEDCKGRIFVQKLSDS